ncbi:hypothetical protein PYCCODRAFT_1064528 [Trametes coccinea BRFM310]|uniref:Uncharacterized protein n=1 Tax=Trametes coccinea (strain BRFM310) TaxID=1353009 RepID=A0A1Y2IXX8_TRAC3|nr:hypothetical protein PYCCODRAFT_1064528 [Trametes coccinea BRFM310]
MHCTVNSHASFVLDVIHGSQRKDVVLLLCTACLLHSQRRTRAITHKARLVPGLRGDVNANRCRVRVVIRRVKQTGQRSRQGAPICGHAPSLWSRAAYSDFDFAPSASRQALRHDPCRLCSSRRAAPFITERYYSGVYAHIAVRAWPCTAVDISKP